MKEYKATDPEMVQAQKDLAKMSNLSDRVITNDDDLFLGVKHDPKKIMSNFLNLSLIFFRDMRTY